MSINTKKYGLGRSLSCLLDNPVISISESFSNMENDNHKLKIECYLLKGKNELLRNSFINKERECDILNMQLNAFVSLSEVSSLPKQKKIKVIDNRKTYLMKDNNTGLYKIGYSKNPKARESTLQCEKPSINMVKVWNKNIESKLHSLYSEFRIRGEWFDLSKIQVRYICTHF